MKIKKSLIFLALVLILIFTGFDQWTKWAVSNTLPLGYKLTIIPHFFNLTYVQNYGAGFSIMEGYGVFFFSIITIVALIVLAYYFFKSNDMKIQICLSFVFSGALGNWIDRLCFGYVRDFFSFRIFGQPFPVFNIADICITVGFFCIILIILIEDWKAKQEWNKNHGL